MVPPYPAAMNESPKDNPDPRPTFLTFDAVLTSHDRRLAVGSFHSVLERRDVAETLSDALRRLRCLPAAD